MRPHAGRAAAERRSLLQGAEPADHDRRCLDQAAVPHRRRSARGRGRSRAGPVGSARYQGGGGRSPSLRRTRAQPLGPAGRMIGVLIRLLRDLRLVPVVLIAIIALFALKALGLVLDGGYLFDGVAAGHDDMEITGTIAAPKPERLPRKQPPAAPKSSWAQEMFNYPGVTGPVRTT